MDGPYPNPGVEGGDGGAARTGHAHGVQADPMMRLKELLFERDSRDIGSLAERIAELQKRAGSDEQFRKSVARVLEEAIREAEAVNHRNLADAMSPMVVRTLRTEIASKDMQDQIAGTMYPRVGEMVSRYVASAFRDMMASINRRLEAKFKQNRLALWLRSLTTGRSMAELALADTQRLEVSEIYLVKRGSGALVHHWRRPGSPDVPPGANRDTLVSGFLAAITAFAEEAFEANRDSLRTLDLDKDRIYFRGAPDYLLAARCEGTAPAAIERLLDDDLLRVLNAQKALEYQASAAGRPSVDPAARDSLLASFAENVEAAAAESTRKLSGSGFGFLKALLWGVGLPLAALAAWYFYVGWITSDLQTRADETLARISPLKGYPIRAIVERGGRRIWVSGLAPDEATHRLTLGEIKALSPSSEVNDAVGVLPRTDLDAHLVTERLRRSLDRATRKLGSLAAELSALGTRIDDAATRDAITAVAATATKAIAKIGGADPAALQADLLPLKAMLDEFRSRGEGVAQIANLGPAPEISGAADATETVDGFSDAADRIVSAMTVIEQRRRVAPVSERVQDLETRLEARLAEIDQRLQALKPAPPSARERLQAFIRTTAIFFAADAEYRDAASASASLDVLAKLMKEAKIYIRVVGYTDEIGNAARNSPLSQQRADKVIGDLVARGVPHELLLGVGRANLIALAPGTGVDSANRRVEFEMAFAGEKSARP
ncbi:MAG: OmpA family protein [Proteobacteria bacterium]|nr:OmpA family protein [Pseudomonadota bacterium]